MDIVKKGCGNNCWHQTCHIYTGYTEGVYETCRKQKHFKKFHFTILHSLHLRSLWAVKWISLTPLSWGPKTAPLVLCNVRIILLKEGCCILPVPVNLPHYVQLFPISKDHLVHACPSTVSLHFRLWQDYSCFLYWVLTNQYMGITSIQMPIKHWNPIMILLI